MPTTSSATAPVFSGKIGFTAAFFQTHTPTTEPRRDEASEALKPATSYSAELHGSHADFCRGVDFGQYRNEMRGNLDLLIAFCRKHNMPDAEEIARRFDLLFEQRFETSHFDIHSELLDSAGKRSLDDFCAMIRDERLPKDKRMAAIKNLSLGVEDCASGTVSNLIFANRELTLSCGGFRAALWQMKEALTYSVLQEAVSERLGHNPSYSENEIHYVNAVWNHLAPTFGFDPVPDPRAPQIGIDLLASCQEKVRVAMTPDRIACLLAEQILAKFHSGLAMPAEQMFRHYDAAVGKDFLDTVDAIRQELGLSEVLLSLHAFVRLDENDSTYWVYSDPSLIAWDILKAMRAERLMDDLPVNRGEWLENGERYAMLTYGADLAVRARRPDLMTMTGWNLKGASATPGGVADLAWHEDAEVDLLTIPALRGWLNAQAADAERPPYTSVRKAVNCSDPEDLLEIPPTWFGDGQLILDVFARFHDRHIERYLSANLSYFLGVFSEQDRVLLFERVAGSGNAARTLARAWFSNSWKNAKEGNDIAPSGLSLVYRGMVQNNARAIDGLRELAVEILPSLTDDEGIYRILGGSTFKPALYHAMAEGHDKAIDAWHRLLVEPKIIVRVKHLLEDLLIADGIDGRSALLGALEAGRASAIKAYGALLADPAILPEIAKKLPRLLAATDPHGVPGLNAAVCRGRTQAVQAYHAVLINAAILPNVVHALPELFGAGNSQRDAEDLALMDMLSQPLLPAIDQQLWSTIEAYYALLAEPAVLSRIAPAWSSLWGADTQVCAYMLTRAICSGRDSLVRAFHALITHPAIISHDDVEALPRLLHGMTWIGKPALAWALNNGHAPAIHAFHAFLADPAVLPRIGHMLADLFAAVTDRLDASRLDPASRLRHAEATSAYFSMLDDPAFDPYIAEKRTELKSVADARPVSANRDANRSALE